MCNWRRSLKIAYQNKQVVEKANERENLQWLFLTLTVRNVDAEELPETLSELSKGFYRLFKYKRVSGAVRGYFRALEVTRNADKDNPEWYGTYHPHFHVLIAVRPSYFKKAYIKQADWVALWRKAMRLDYDPIVHIQRVKPKAELDEMVDYEADVKKAIAEQKAILEVSKYPVKDSEVINPELDESENVETLLTLDDALAFKRLIGYGGILKEIHAELNLDDAEEGNLVNVTDEDEISNAVFDIMAKWHIGLNRYIVTRTKTQREPE
jgi:plasmid rolling circle replication initiator protein Rep